MIKIDKKDTIIDILTKMKEETGNDMIIAFPFWHPVLHNYLSLKIIKTRAANKNLLIVTSDQTSRKIGKHLGINYSFVNDDTAYEDATTTSKIMKHNFSFFEYLQFEIKHFFRDFKDYFSENKSLKYYSLKYSKEQWKIGFFVFWFLISAGVLLMIFYFAVTKTYVSITPEISIRERGKNFIFKEMSQEWESLRDNIIQLRKVSKALYVEDTFATTGIDDSKVQKSSGKVVLVNQTLENVRLFPHTRLATSTGVVLETQTSVEIPAGSKDTGVLIPGTIEVSAISALRNQSWKLQGESSNVPNNTRLSIPWLQKDVDLIFWRTSWVFLWGKDYSDGFIISQSNVDNAKKILEEKLKNESLKALQKEIKKENDFNNVTFEILGIDDIIKYSGEEEMLLDGVHVGDSRKNFRLGWSINVETYIYNKNSVISKLKNIVNDSILEWSEKLLMINEDSLRASTIVYKQKDPFEVKVTMEIEAFVIHNFLNENDAYVKKLKNSIIGLPQDEGEKILINDPKISNAKIDITPFFIHTVASLPNNIIFQIQENIK